MYIQQILDYFIVQCFVELLKVPTYNLSVRSCFLYSPDPLYRCSICLILIFSTFILNN